MQGVIDHYNNEHSVTSRENLNRSRWLPDTQHLVSLAVTRIAKTHREQRLKWRLMRQSSIAA